MRKTMMAALLGAAMASGAAMAQDTGTADWYVVTSTENGMSTMDMGRLQRRGDAVVAESTLYLVRPKRHSDGTVVDFIRTMDTYDCSDPGRIRNVMSAGFRADQKEPVFFYGEDELSPEWRRFESGSPGMDVWTAACKGPNPQWRVKNMETHNQLLDLVRRQAAELGM